jgi:hypothetical protein
MKKLTTSGVNARKERASELRAFICALLKCTNEQYAELVYNEGLKYLKHYLPDDPEGREMLNRSRVFWNWWKNHFANRDEEFKGMVEAHPLLPTHREEIMRQLYLNYNDGRQLALNLHPQSVVLEESYSDMIHKLLRKEVTI